MRVEPYVMLSGRTKEALAFYSQAIDAETVKVMRFAQSPYKNHPMPLPPDKDKKSCTARWRWATPPSCCRTE